MVQILVTGATGFIGSHLCLVLLRKGYEIIGIDSFENSSPESLKRVVKILKSHKNINPESLKLIKGDIRDQVFIKKVFDDAFNKGKPIKAVIHLAGLKSVVDSLREPIKFWDYNVLGSINLFKIMDAFDCRTLVFSSSATVYDQSNILLNENTPINPINPYGRTKVVVENILNDLYLSPEFNWKIMNLRYFNPIGAHESGMIGEDSKSESTNIFPLINRVALGKINKLKIFGNDWETNDGTCIRDYIHIMDLVEGHLFALENLLNNTNQFLNINLGTGRGVSVLELISTFEKVNNVSVPYVFAERRSGDKVKCVADNSLASKVLNWRTKRSLEEMCRDGWKWQKLNPNGYESLS